ncbi:MAG: hypothetical protein AB7G10_18835 [Reyranellaceae bacterium]
MSDAERANPAKAGEIAQQVVKILAGVDQETQKRALDAVMILLGHEPRKPFQERKVAEIDRDDAAGEDLGTFFQRDGDFRPADYALLCAAFHFSQFGNSGFTLQDIRAIASNAGVVIPDRLDMTFANSTDKGKRLFQKLGRGSFKPTTAAGLSFKERWSVKPGRQVKPSVEGN